MAGGFQQGHRTRLDRLVQRAAHRAVGQAGDPAQLGAAQPHGLAEAVDMGDGSGDETRGWRQRDARQQLAEWIGHRFLCFPMI
jgi:hypothetical protein